MPETLGLIVLLKDGTEYTIARRRVFNESDIGEAVEDTRRQLAARPDIYRDTTEVAIGVVTIQESSHA